jgi:chemotaxis protein CheD
LIGLFTLEEVQCADRSMRLKEHVRGVDGVAMKRMQLRSVDVDALQVLAGAATERAATNLSRLVGAEVVVDRPRLRVDTLASAASLVASLPQRTSIALTRVEGELAGDLLLVLPMHLERALLDLLQVDRADEQLRTSALMEVGNIVLGGYLVPMLDATGLTGRPSVPMLGSGDPQALLEHSIARAASDDDVVLSIDATFSLEGEGVSHRRMHVMFLPAPGTLAHVLARTGGGELARGGDGSSADDREVQVVVHMGELAVARRPGDVLLARGLGSCVAVALVDPVASVAALAHVMLPNAPERSRGASQTYPGRYADTAITALVDALMRAGGIARRARAFVAGGSQMFQGLIDARELQIHDRNVAVVLDELVRARIPIEGMDAGGSAGRTLEVRIEPLSVTCSIPLEGRTIAFLDAAA